VPSPQSPRPALRPSGRLLLQVKLLKCLVEDVVVDISFETIGGLRAATFLTSLDLEISKRCRGDCLFIRSVILVRPWCWLYDNPSCNCAASVALPVCQLDRRMPQSACPCCCKRPNQEHTLPSKDITINHRRTLHRPHTAS